MQSPLNFTFKSYSPKVYFNQNVKINKMQVRDFVSKENIILLNMESLFNPGKINLKSIIVSEYDKVILNV